jgi:hypothetical protein
VIRKRYLNAVAGSIESLGLHIGAVTSSHGGIGAAIKSAAHIGGITAYGGISGCIEAATYIGSLAETGSGILAQYGPINSPEIITGDYLGAVRAGEEIESPMTIPGRIVTIHAGTQGIGAISGNINVGGTIDSLIAQDIRRLPEVPAGVARPRPRRIDGSSGDITGTIHAGGTIGLLHAFGNLALVDAEGSLSEVK